MTERGLPSVDGAPACPFVAFDDDRESRSTSPDHRHRCYAEPLPAPRAAAHQEAYCLSSAFPVCPTFQDWAKREAAHARGEGERPAPAPTATPRAAPPETGSPHGNPLDADEDDDELGTEPSRGRGGARGEETTEDRADAHEPADEPDVAPPSFTEIPIRRNPPRDWAAPPPWAPGGTGSSSAGGSRRSPDGRGSAEGTGTPEFLAGPSDESRGLAGSAADRLASGAPGTGPSALPPSFSSVAAPPDAELAGLVGPARAGDRPVHGYQAPARPGNRPRVSSTRSGPPRDAIAGPAWERSRRFEAYPTIRTRVGMPQLPRVAVLAVALAIAALGLFFLPALLGVGGGGGNGGTGTVAPSTSQSAESASPEPPATAVAPSAQVYVIKAGDTLSKVAKRFGVSLAELLAANKDTITNPDKVAIGDEIVIPSAVPDVINDASAEPSAS